MQAKLKKQLKLNIHVEENDENEEFPLFSSKNKTNLNYKAMNKEDYNRGNNDNDRLKSNNTNEIDLIRYYLSSSNKDYDFSYHWYEKCSKLSIISEAIKISCVDENFTEPIRDYLCEFELLKLITEDNYHKDNMIELPRTLKKLNRYKDILPYKYNTVFLSDIKYPQQIMKEEFLNDNYVNASYINGSLEDLTEKMFISTQAPLKNTFSQFWKMVYLNKSKLILMLCNLFEDIRVKCDQYWPDVVGKKVIYGNEIEVELITEEKILDGLIIKRDLCITPYHEEDFQLDYSSLNKTNSHDDYNNSKDDVLVKGDKHYVSQFHVVCWPDHSVPNNKIAFKLFDFITSTIYYNYKISLDNNIKNSPTVVHCSAGIGRTGTMIAIYNVFDHLKRQVNTIMKNNNINNNNDDNISNGNHNIFFSVFCSVRKLREQRFGFVSDISQYIMIYNFAYNWIRYYYYGKEEKQIIEQHDNQIESQVMTLKEKPYINKGDIIINQMNFSNNKNECSNFDNNSNTNNNINSNINYSPFQSNFNYINSNTHKSKGNLNINLNAPDFNYNYNNNANDINSVHDDNISNNTSNNRNNTNSNTNSNNYYNMNMNMNMNDNHGYYEFNSTSTSPIPTPTNNFNFSQCFTTTNRYKKKNIDYSLYNMNNN